MKRLQKAKGQEAIGQVLCEQHGLSRKEGTLHEWVKKRNDTFFDLSFKNRNQNQS